MIPNILYSILRNNSNNTDNNNSNNNPDNNPDNNSSINNPNSSPNANTNNNPEDNPGSNNRIYDNNQLITQPPTLTTSSNPNTFSNIRFGAPVCILRAPSDLDIPSTTSGNTNENSSEQTPLSTVLLPSSIPGNTSSSLNQSVESAKVDDKTTGGIFSDKHFLHVIPVEGNNNLFMNRISYNTQTDAYYENGNLSDKYLKVWREGAYQWDNIEKKNERDWMKTYLARMPTDDRMNDDGEISWKFDYRIGNYVINSLKIRLSFGTFDDSASVQWSIKPLPTMKKPNPNWQSIQFEPYTEYRHEANEVKDVTQFVKDEYGFILKAHLSGGESTEVIWQKTQLFRQDWNRLLARGIDVEDDNTFGLDIKVQLKPDIIVDPLPEIFVLNDESTSDFVIHYEFSTGDNQDISSSNSSDKKSKESKESKDFHVHSAVLSKRSDYFKALLESRMIESQNKSLTLTDTDISHDSLEIILNYLYTGTLSNIKGYDEWTTLLNYASRFLIPTLIQRCEKELKSYLNHDTLDEIKVIASESGAEQLLQCCEKFELPKV